jgi:hypothetical protein
MIKQILKYLLIFGIWTLVINCNHRDDVKASTVWYKDFDIFKLNGIDKLEKLDNKQSVEVHYDKGLPISIIYHKPERLIVIQFEDSFKINSNPIYVYSTSNLNGGQPGKNRVYATHNEEHKDILFISLSDTMLCKREDVPKSKNNNFDLYVKNDSSNIFRISKGEYDDEGENDKMTKENLYLKWYGLLRQELGKDSIISEKVNKLPG